MNRIEAAFATAKREERAARIPFVCCGDPGPGLTVPIGEALARAGADIIELGVPWSDPLADGPVIQRAAKRALEGGTGLRGAIGMAEELRVRVGAPLVLFSYYNPIHRFGERAFVEAVAGAGIDGVLVTDLPLEEGGGLRSMLRAHGVDPILLVAPTSGRERVSRIVDAGSGFIYCISRTGVTGARASIPDGLAEDVARIRAAGSLPVAVGFGISTRDQVRAVADLADGVVVGSALVSALEEAHARGAGAELPAEVGRAAARIFGT